MGPRYVLARGSQGPGTIRPSRGHSVLSASCLIAHRHHRLSYVSFIVYIMEKDYILGRKVTADWLRHWGPLIRGLAGRSGD